MMTLQCRKCKKVESQESQNIAWAYVYLKDVDESVTDADLEEYVPLCTACQNLIFGEI